MRALIQVVKATQFGILNTNISVTLDRGKYKMNIQKK